MAFCGKCGHENDEGAVFCGGCGARLDDGLAEPVVNEEQDDYGTAETDEQEEGAPVAAAPTPVRIPSVERRSPTPAPRRASEVARSQEKKKMPWWKRLLITLGIIAGVVLALFIALVVWSTKTVLDNEKNIKEELKKIEKTPASEQTFKGQLLSELAKEKGFPFVEENVLPQDGATYVNESGEVQMTFNVTNYMGDSPFAYLDLSSPEDGEQMRTELTPCGCSIYAIRTLASDEIVGYIFIEADGNAVLLHAEGFGNQRLTKK